MAKSTKQAQSDFNTLIKVIIIGDSAVGKTSLILRYCTDHFSTMHLHTLGVDFRTKFIDMDGDRVKYQIWDTAGQERFRSMAYSHFRRAHGVILVYDISDRQSFESLKSWMEQIELYAGNDINKIIIGNKCDLPDSQRAVQTWEGQELAQRYSSHNSSHHSVPTDHSSVTPQLPHGGGGGTKGGRVKFFECSAKQSIQVSDAFLSLARDVKHRLDREASKEQEREKNRERNRERESKERERDREKEGGGGGGGSGGREIDKNSSNGRGSGSGREGEGGGSIDSTGSISKSSSSLEGGKDILSSYREKEQQQTQKHSLSSSPHSSSYSPSSSSTSSSFSLQNHSNSNSNQERGGTLSSPQCC